MSIGQLLIGVLVNATITYILYKIDTKAALIYVGLLLLMMLTVYRAQFFASLTMLQNATAGIGRA